MSGAAGLVSQLDVLNALVLRETRTRFGSQQLGYLWAFIEPILWITSFSFMFAVVGREPPLDMSMVGFVATGLIPFQIFREATGRAMTAVDANKSLLFYPQVRPLDLVLARTWLEAATMITVLTVLLSFDAIVLGMAPPADPLRMLLGLSLAAGLGSGLGLCLGSIAVYTPTIERLVSPILRPLFWVSGIFFTANGLPGQVREIMLYNPVLHIIELMRDGLSAHYAAIYARPAYVFAWVLCTWALGLTLERVARRRLEVV